MKLYPTILRRTAPAALLLAASLAAPPLWAAPPSEAQRLLRQELAACDSSPQGRATCVREAQAAYAQNRRGALEDHAAADYKRNASQRCDALPETDRADCVARMQGEGTTSGSAATGGIYRELTTITTEPEVKPAPEVTPK